MNWLSILDVPGLVSKSINTIIDRVLPDWNADADLKRDIEKMKLDMTKSLEQNIQKTVDGQLKINYAEIVSGNWWTRSWRPGISWVCTLSLGYTYLANPIGNWVLENFFETLTLLPNIPSENMFELIIAMLGMSGLRSFDKLKKKNKLADFGNN